MDESHRLRRSLLFVPGGDPRKLERAAGAGADTLLLDLEDAVAPDHKERARSEVARWLESRPQGGSEAAVRINPAGTPWFEEDLAAVAGAGAGAVMLPKCESAGDVARAAEALGALEREAGSAGSVRLLALVESAAGVSRAGEIAAAADRVDALCFGHADFSLDMGLTHPDSATGVIHHARCAVAVAARAAGVAPVDTVCLDVRDEAAFLADAELGLRLGFDGKLCIHPAQVAIANRVWTPTEEQIAAARRVVEAWNEAQAKGVAVFALDGKMVDPPVVAVHERVLERARRAGVLEDA
jgi:citrate lyase subunit beta/citryl-CoA lyase